MGAPCYIILLPDRASQRGCGTWQAGTQATRSLPSSPSHARYRVTRALRGVCPLGIGNYSPGYLG